MDGNSTNTGGSDGNDPSMDISPFEVRGRTALAIVAGATLGNMLSIGTILTYSLGVFIIALQDSFGWSRGQISLAQTVFTLVMFVGSPLAGRMADRRDPGLIAMVSLIAFGAFLLTAPYVITSPTTLLLAYFLMAVAGIGTLPAVLLKPVMASFTKRRGLAMGTTLCGSGIAAFIVPPFTSLLVDGSDWRLAYRGLGTVVILASPLVWLALRNRVTETTSGPESTARQEGLSLEQAMRKRAFWTLLVISAGAGFALAGPAAHMVPLAVDNGLAMRDAALFASALGLSSVTGRIFTGYILDRVQSPLAGIVFLGVGALGALIMAMGHSEQLLVGALCIGFALGAEVDMIAYFVTRYFGLRSSATIFGLNFGLVALGSAFGPYMLGVLRDQQGDYAMGLIICAAVFAISALACGTLKPFPSHGRDHPLPHAATSTDFD